MSEDASGLPQLHACLQKYFGGQGDPPAAGLPGL
jgi:hypothetical protein